MIDCSAVVTDLLPALNSTTTADLTWWSTDNLYQYADEAAKALASLTGAFADFDALSTASANVPNPTGCLTIVHVAVNGATARPASVREIEALSASWLSDSGTPTRWIGDVGGLGSFNLYPAPAGAVTLDRIFHSEPAAIAAGSAAVSLPASLAAYFFWSLLARARSQEGEAAMPEVAKHAAERAATLAQAARAYYGGTQ